MKYFDETDQTKINRAICVGRNFAAHALELNNPVPNEPVIFIKSGAALTSWQDGIYLDQKPNICHYEIEVGFLISNKISKASIECVQSKIGGFTLALDLTLRDEQSVLKQKGLPWELAKSFDNACVIGPIWNLPKDIDELYSVEFGLEINGNVVQKGRLEQTIWKPLELIAHISQSFTLLPGDIVLTGTPQGVGELKENAELVGWFGENRLPISRVNYHER